MKSYREAQKYRGGIIKYLYDEIKQLRSDMDDEFEEDKFTVTVTVKDGDGAAVAGATCAIGDRSATSAESTGVASISNVPGGAATLTVSKTGYVTATKSVRISKPMTYTIVIEEEPSEEEE